MNGKSIVLLLVLLVLGLFLFGCTSTTPVCGDGICSIGEDYVCPTDCGGVSDTGYLKIKIVPGYGTVYSDLDSLIGQKVSVCSYSSNECREEIINSDLLIVLNSYKKGYYSLENVWTKDKSVPISLDSANPIYVSEESTDSQIKAYKGISYLLKVVVDGSIVSSDKVKVLRYCEYSENDFFGYYESCVGREGVLWREYFKINPFVSNYSLTGTNIYSRLNMVYSIQLEFGGIVKDFNYSLKQGENEIIFDFNPVDDLIYFSPEVLNLDFEEGSLGSCPYNWTCTSDAMLASIYDGAGCSVSGGDYSGLQYAKAGCDSTVGSLTSTSFVLPDNIVSVSFLRAGGADAGSGFYLKKVLDDSVLCSSENGADTDTFFVDSCGGLVGQDGVEVYIFIRDNQNSGWGKVYVDNIQLVISK